VRPNRLRFQLGARKRFVCKCALDRDRPPTVTEYCRPIFGELRFNASGWAQGEHYAIVPKLPSAWRRLAM
jgi:hypothetical protein